MFVPELLHPDCEWVVHDLTEYTDFPEEGCDGASLAAMHARAAPTDGVMNHTVSGQAWRNLWFNGTPGSARPGSPLFAATWGCPVLLVTGDEANLQRGDRAARPRPRDRRRQEGPWPLQRAPCHRRSAHAS